MGQHQVTERREEVPRVVRPGRGLRVVLHGEGRGLQGPEPLDHPVVEVHVRRLGVRNGAGGNGVVVVLARDLDHAGLEALHRVVGAVVTEGQLVGRAAQCGGEDLVPEADAEDRDLPHQIGHGGGGAGQRGRVARAVGEEDAVGLEGHDVGGGGARRHHRDGAHGGEQGDHGGLDAEVVGDDAQAAPRPLPCPRVDGRDIGGHARDQVHAVGRPGRCSGGAQLGLGCAAEGAGHRTGVADVAGQAAGVDAGQGGHPVPAQEGLEALRRAPVRRLPRQIAHHDPPAVRGRGLVVGGVRPVVADVRAGERDHLPA